MPFNVSLSGLNAAASDLEVTSNNIANVNTTGFKQSRAEFADLFSVSSQDVSATAIGNGVRVAAVSQQFGQGNIEYTNNSLDLALSGKGFFTVRNSSGLAYTRAGAFNPDRNGYVVNPQGDRLQVYPPTASGGFDISTLTDLQLLTAQSAPKASANAQLQLNLPADATPPTTVPFNPADPTSFNQSTAFTVYDSLGATHTSTLYFVKNAANNTWDSYMYLDGNAAGPSQQVVFSQNGALQAPAGGKLAFPPQVVNPGAQPLALTLDFSSATQYGNAFSVTGIQQDGYATGRLSGIEVGADGVVSARFSNGQSTALGKVALATFADPQALQQLGNTSWGETFQSGQAVRGTAGSGNLGEIQSGALEASNVDLTAELVNMIKAQRNYQANAQMISTDDKITQTVINIHN